MTESVRSETHALSLGRLGVFTIARGLTLGVVVIGLVLCAIGGLAAFVMSLNCNAMAEITERCVGEMQAAEAFESGVLNARIHFIYHVTIQKPGALDAGWTRFGQAKQQLPRLTSLSTHPQLAHLGAPTERLRRELTAYEALLGGILDDVAAGRNHQPAFASTIAEWARQGAALVDTARELSKSAAATAFAMREAQLAQARQMVAWLFLGCVMAAALVAAGGFFIARRISDTLRRAARQLDDSAETLSGASGLVSASSSSLAAGAEAQIGSVDEATEWCDQISQMAVRTETAARALDSIMGEAGTILEQGLRTADRTQAAMEEVRASGEGVTNVIRVISDIAFQTNILALNAAVEAARAGASGQGFAVVADEVRQLAQRSADAVRQTSELVGKSVAANGSGRKHVEELSKVLHSIAGQTTEARRMAGAVAVDSSSQIEVLGQVAGAVAQVRRITGDVSGNASQTSDAATRISVDATIMQEVAASLSSLVG